MTDTEQRALLDLCFAAAMADGTTSDVEREALQRAAERLGRPAPPAGDASPDAGARHRAIAEVAASLRDPATARLAFEVAVAVCGADGPPNQAEQWFLTELERELRLD